MASTPPLPEFRLLAGGFMPRRIAFLSVIAVVLVVLVGGMTPAAVSAHTWDRLAYLTFSGPVQVPGATLGAGTYRFRLVNPDSGLRVFQVLSHDGRTVHAMFFTNPDSRMNVTDNPTVTFKETPAGVPPAIKSLFYGGERTGYEFVYTGRALAMAFPTRPHMPITYTANWSTETSDAVTAPELLVTEAETFAEPVAEPVVEPGAEPTPAETELPKTASSIPLVAFGGFVSLILGLGVGLIRRHLS
jgi:hypothetical protein